MRQIISRRARVLGAILLCGGALAGARSVPAAAPGTPKIDFLIDKALWGTPTHWLDVTQKIQTQIGAEGALDLNVADANRLFGDPARGTEKTLKLEYKYKGRAYQKEFAESDYIVLPYDPVPPRAKLKILSARFGTGKTWLDVTDKLRGLMKNGKLRLNVHGGASTKLGDPLKGAEKQLQIRYAIDGKVQETSVTESDHVCIKLP